ncbi:hypothetical protein ACGK9R_15575 [Halomonas sp. HNIBRBA4712]|uniref:hypothetical protein n=1 Tax=Halomonas sp. HNIBRBA4712 TaxID=3373087 RepID=UPI0037455C38
MIPGADQQRLLDAWRECRRHHHFIDYAITSLERVLPLTGERLASLDDAHMQSLDQFVLVSGSCRTLSGRAFFLPYYFIFRSLSKIAR